MTDQKPHSSVGSTIATTFGVIAMTASLTLCAFNPKISIALAIFIGVVTGVPFILLGFRLHPTSVSDIDEYRHFWPRKSEIWGILMFLTFLGATIGIAAIFLTVAYLLPSGDNWGIVVLRLSLMVLAGCTFFWWFNYPGKGIAELFRGKLSDATIDELTRDEPNQKREPETPIAVILTNWELLLIAAIAFAVAFGFIDFNHPWLENLDTEASNRRVRSLARNIAWCRDNPNTVFSSSLLVGCGALGWYLYLIMRTARGPEAKAEDSAMVEDC